MNRRFNASSRFTRGCFGLLAVVSTFLILSAVVGLADHHDTARTIATGHAAPRG